MTRILYFFLIVLVLLFCSCNLNTSENTSFYTVVPTGFTDDIFLDGTVEAVNSKSLSCPEIYDVKVAFIVEEGTLVKEGDTVCILENKELLDNYESTLKNLEQNKAEYNKSQADLAMNYALLEAQVETNKAQTSISNLDSLQLLYSSEAQRKITELELKIAQIEKIKLQKKLAALNKINTSEMRKFSLRIKQSENRVELIADRLKQLVVLAPKDGLALRGLSPMGTGKLKEGDLIYPGMTLVEIPDLNLMKVKITANEAAYKRIAVGQRVEYTFDAMPGNKASGKISMKAPVGNPVKRNSKVRVFDLYATVDSFLVNPGAGLSANCRVIVDQVSDAIVVPNVTIFEEDTLKVVYVKMKNGFQRREIINGLHSPTNSVVMAGLTEGETLAMIKPQQNQIKSECLLTADQKARLKTTKEEKKDNFNVQNTLNQQE